MDRPKQEKGPESHTAAKQVETQGTAAPIETGAADDSNTEHAALVSMLRALLRDLFLRNIAFPKWAEGARVTGPFGGYRVDFSPSWGDETLRQAIRRLRGTLILHAAHSLEETGVDPVAVLEERETLEDVHGQDLPARPTWEQILQRLRDSPEALAHPSVSAAIVEISREGRWRPFGLKDGSSARVDSPNTRSSRARLEQLVRALLFDDPAPQLLEEWRITRAGTIETWLEQDVRENTGEVAESLERAAQRFCWTSGAALRRELSRAAILRKARAAKIEKWVKRDMERPGNTTPNPTPPAHDRNASLERAAYVFGWPSGRALQEELERVRLRKRRKQKFK